MSQLMAEMLDLTYLQSTDLSLDDNSELHDDTTAEMACLEERSEKAMKRRELKILDAQLKSVHQRISHALNEAGYSTELPEPCLENAPVLSFRPPEFCVKNETKESEELKKMKKVCNVFMDSANLRNSIVKAVGDWMDATSSLLDGRSMRVFEQALAKRDCDAKKSVREIAEALNQAKCAMKKLKSIGRVVFDEKNDDDSEKSAMSEKTLARVNERVRRNSDALDAVPVKKRANFMKKMLHGLEEFPGDMTALLASYDANDEEEQVILQEMNAEWRTACNDIRDLLVSVHEVKLLHRNCKLKIRRILYLFKLVVAVLEIRDNAVDTAEDQLIDLQAEVVGLRAKVDHIHTETKKWREKYTKTQSIVVKISKERDESRYETEKLRIELGSCIDKIADLNNLIKELKVEATKAPKNVISEDDNKKLIELKELNSNQSYQIQALGEEIDKLRNERDELREQLGGATEKDKEKELIQEQMIRDANDKLEMMNKKVDDFEEKAALFEDDLFERDAQIKLLKVELEAKNEMVKKLTTMAEESDSDREPSPPPRGTKRRGRKGSPAFGRRRSHCQYEEEQRNAEMDGPDYERRQSISQLARSSSTKILRRSSVRLLTTPSASRMQAPVSAIPQPSPSIHIVNVDTGDKSVPQLREATTQVSAVAVAISGISNEEYLRVREGWEESERRCNELEVVITEIEDELLEMKKKHKKRAASQAREFRMQNIMAEEERRSEVSAVYSQALNMENLINRYKNDLSQIFERALLQKIAKDVKNVYNYNSSEDPSDPTSSLKTVNQWVDIALKKLVKYQQAVIKHMQSTQDDLKVKAEKSVGQETANHIKILAEKTMEIGKYKQLADQTKNELVSLKSDHQKLVRQHAQNREDLKNAEEQEKKTKELWKKRERELLDAGDAVAVYKKSAKDAQKLDAKLKDLKSEYKKLKEQYDMSQRNLAREAQLRMMAEKEVQRNNRSQKLGFRDEKPPVVKIVYQEEKPPGPSQAAVYVKTMEKLLECKPSLRLSHITSELANDASISVRNYRIQVARRLVKLCQKYADYKRLTDMQQRVRATILAKNKEETPSERIKAKRHGGLEKFHTIYWHLEYQQELIKHRGATSDVDNLVAKYRNDVGKVFHKIAEILLKRKQEIKDRIQVQETKQNENKEQTTRQLSDSTGSENSSKRPVVPSNSVLSVDSSNNINKPSFHTTTDASLTVKKSMDHDVIIKKSILEDDKHEQIHRQKSDVEVVEEVISELLVNKEKDEKELQPVVETKESENESNESNDGQMKINIEKTNSSENRNDLAGADINVVESANANEQTVGDRNERRRSETKVVDKNRSSKENIVTSTPTRVFSRTNSLAPDVSDEYKKNQNLLTALSHVTSSTRRSSIATAAPEQTWDRRLSLVVHSPLPIRKSSAWIVSSNEKITSHPSRSSMLTQISPEVPKTLQLDVHDVLHKARKHLQNSIRRHSMTERPPSTSLSDLGSFIRSRRSTITGGILPGVIERNDGENNLDENEMMKQYRLPFDSFDQNEIIPKITAGTSNAFEIQAVQAPANHFLPKSRPATKSTVRRESIRRKSVAAPPRKQQSSQLYRKPSAKEKFENEMEDKEFKKLDKCLSDETSNYSSSIGVRIIRRKSTSDVITLPSISSSSIYNK
ncbi:uncharacterized protein LOC120331937 [Styela clava]